MTDTQKQHSPQLATKPSIDEVIFHILIVLGVAFVLATLFTGLTPGLYTSIENISTEEVVQNPSPSPTTPGPTETPRPIKLIGIVSGHWENDSGAVCEDGLTEAAVNQNIATLVQKILIERGFEVDLLREFDSRLENYQALALVSIHADSCDYINDQATGFKVASALATSNKEQSAYLTACIRSRYAKVTGLSLHTTSLTPDMTRYHAFAEIDPNTPAAIIETGFLNLDRQLLTENPEKVALGIVEGIMCFVNREAVAETQPTPNP